jgi:hypothetical protein
VELEHGDVRYVILFDKAIRFGTVITRIVGPFESVDEAKTYMTEARAAWKGNIPDGVIETLLVDYEAA